MLSRRHILVSGRWDNTISVVDLDAALAGRAAILARPRVTSDIVGSSGLEAACGLPVSLVYSRKLNRIAVINHAGFSSTSEVGNRPHGHGGSVAVLDADKAISGAADGNLSAVIAHIPVAHGPVAGVLLPDERHVLVSSSEGMDSEDGGYRLSLINLVECRHVMDFELGYHGKPCGNATPAPDFGRYPNPCGLAFTQAHGGVFLVANGGSADVSVIPLAHILERRPQPETGRIRISSGGFGIAINPQGNLAAVANREDPRTGRFGSCVTLIDVSRALETPEQAVVADIAVGSREESRPCGVCFNASGSVLYATCTDDGTVSRIEGLDDPKKAVVTACMDLDGQGTAMPRGVSMGGKGDVLLVAGGQKAGPVSARLWILDANNLAVLAQVPGVGNESYFFFNDIA